jgi:phosphoenolpyruvate-protein kinase (PTS system EI component)
MSIGSNDLLQYTFAADRGNELVSETFQALHPIFLKVLKQISESFKKKPEKELALCGEMAGNVLATPFLIGAGIYELSMPPRQIPLVKKVIRAFSVKECEDLLNEAISLNNLEAVNCLAKNALASKGLGDPV